MNVLWITRFDPRVVDSGANMYTRGLLRGLAAAGVEVSVLGYDSGRSAMRPLPGVDLELLPSPRRSRLLSLVSPLQSDAYRAQSAAFADRISLSITSELSAVVLDYFAMGWALPTIAKAVAGLGGRRPVIVYVSHNHEQTVRRQVAASYGGNPLVRSLLLFDARKAAKLEAQIVAGADLVTTTTDQDRELFRAAAPSKAYLTLAPGYDGGPVGALAVLSEFTPRRVAVLGSFDWIAKRESFRRFVDAADGPFRRLGIELVVIGRAGAKFVADIEARSPICRFVGFVDDPASILQSARLGLMPDELGGGFKLRNLDYIFRGLPVAGIRSQMAGLPFPAKDGMIVGDDVRDLVANITGAIDDLPRLIALRDFALSNCIGRFDWESRGASLRAAIESQRAGAQPRQR